MKLDTLQARCRAAGLGALMAAAGLLTRLLPIPQPVLLVGPGSSRRLGQLIAAAGHRKLLLGTDPMVARLGLLRGVADALQAGGVPFVVFDQVTPDAPLPVIEQGLRLARAEGCDALLAVGGGSAIDAAKAMAAAQANPQRPLTALAGYFKGRRRPLPLYAVPTTAGTGSEVTVAAVVSDPASRRKLVIVDTRLVPRAAALDPALMAGLPPEVTAATGMDALTHAVEAFLGRWARPETDRLALLAVDLVFCHLRTACADGGRLDAREQMALASTCAGMAFTRANVGHVHAIAHQLGGLYHTPHGLANAVVLPPVLRWYLAGPPGERRRLEQRMAMLARRAGLGRAGDDDALQAAAFVAGVEELVRDLGLPTRLDALHEADIPAIARAARHEADTGYPVPRYMTQPACEALLHTLLPRPASATGARPAPGCAVGLNRETAEALA